MAIKVSHTQRAVKNFKNHKAAGTFPPTISCRSAPTCQYSKEYIKGSTKASKLAKLQQVQQKHNKQILAHFIAVKQQKVDFLKKTFLSKKEAIGKITLDLEVTLKAITDITISVHQREEIFKEYTGLLKNLNNYIHRATQIKFHLHRVEVLKREKKVKAKVDTDVNMSDPGIKALIKSLRTELLRKIRNSKKQSKSCTYTSLSTLNTSTRNQNNKRIWEKGKERVYPHRQSWAVDPKGRT